MTYATESVKVDRRPAVAVECDLDTCSLTYGVGACTASGGAGSECYNTRATCQDPDNYAQSTKTYRFLGAIEINAGATGTGYGAGLVEAEEPGTEEIEVDGGITYAGPGANIVSAIPSLVSVSAAPTRLTPGKGIGYRASVTVTLQDHPHHDRGVDPYYSTRSFDAATQGTYWTKLLARNPYYNNRTLRVRSGYVVDAWDWAHFDDREYVIDRIEGPDAAGRVRIVAKDVLKLADDDRSQVPAPSNGELAADVDAADTSLTVSAGDGSEYGSSGYVRIGDEIIAFSGRSTDTLTGLTRGQWGTSPDDHSADDAVQLCKVWDGINVRDIIDELLVTWAGISSSYITAADWDSEESDWLTAYTLTTILTEPTGVRELLDELTRQCQLMLWWDDRAQKIRLKAVAPPRGNVPTQLDDDEHFLADSVTIKDIGKDRLTQQWVYYDKADYTEDALKNYKRLFINADLNAEGADQYGDQRIDAIESRWFDENNSSAVIQTTSRSLNARRSTPRQVKFSLDAKDLTSYSVGDVVDLLTDKVVDFDGAKQALRGIIIEESERIHGTRIDYQLVTGVGSGRFGFIGPNSLNAYSSETEANQLSYGFIAPDADGFSDGTEAYKII